MPQSPTLEAAVDAAWGELLGCSPDLFHAPGAHLVPGGEELAGRERVLMFRVDVATLVYCPERLRGRAASLIAETPPDDAFGVALCARIADVTESEVHGPAWHGFVDRARFVPAGGGDGRRLDRHDPLFDELRRACGDDDWSEGGFFEEATAFDDVRYAIEEEGRLVAAGNMTAYRGRPADVGLVTRPDARGKGLAKRLAVKMVSDALPTVEIVRYRALTTNTASLRVARSLGFEGRGQNYRVRLAA
jgi:GNAT superfamily N-acetyltransferase